jgi:hypothetical protein
MQTARLADEHPASLNAASARNLRFLDREEEIIYPWTRKNLTVGKSEHGNKKEQMIWAAS